MIVIFFFISKVFALLEPDSIHLKNGDRGGVYAVVADSIN